MSLHSISDYKRAQVQVKDLEKILKILNATDASLRNYEKYRPVFHILTTLSTEKAFIEIFLEQSKAVVESKGKRLK